MFSVSQECLLRGFKCEINFIIASQKDKLISFFRAKFVLCLSGKQTGNGALLKRMTRRSTMTAKKK